MNLTSSHAAAAGDTHWRAAVAAYAEARAIADACPTNDPNEDALLDAYCEAMDTCIIDTPAPHFAAVIEKIDWAVERQEGFGFIADYTAAIRADVTRLSGLEDAA